MPFNFRQSEILTIAQQEGKVEAGALADRFGISVQTIRKDLSELSETGKLKRVHGGAILPSGVANIGYEDRRNLNAQAKAAIAARCAQEVPNNASLFLNIGTSTEAVARALGNHRNLMVVTNNMNVANILNENPGCEVVVAGGLLRRSDGGLVGALTTHVIEQFKFDMAVIGCSAMDEDGDLLDFDIQEVGVSQTIIRQARQTVLVADSSKFQRSAPARIASLKDVDLMVTDALLSPALAEKCCTWGTDILLA